MVQLKNGADFTKVQHALQHHPVTKQYLFHVLMSPDVPFNNRTMMFWGWFTRFDPLTDLYPAGRFVEGNQLIFDFPIAIDARWKKGYPKPLEFDPVIEKRVNAQWSTYKIL